MPRNRRRRLSKSLTDTEAADRLEGIKEELRTLLGEARDLAVDRCFFAHYEAYLFEQMEEHIEKVNPHNRDFDDLIREVRGEREED